MSAIGRRQVDCDVRGRDVVAAIFQCSPYPVAALPHRRIRQPHRMELFLIQLDIGKINLNIDDVGVNPIHCSTASRKKH